MMLTGSRGEQFFVPREGSLVLGRANFLSSHSQAAQVSRCQCEFSLVGAPPMTARLTSLAALNPTVVIKSGSGVKTQLKQGEACELGIGDRICLLSTDTSHSLELREAHDGGQRQELTVDSSETAADGTQPSPADQGPLADTDPRTTSQAAPEVAVTATGLCGKPPVMLILCGAPGAGKSTFSARLCAASPVWERVNQDTVKGGKRGTRQQCVAQARQILQQGRCAIIDRCNVEPEQRRDFLQLAQELNLPAHALVLNLPPAMCAAQASGRSSHEGGVEGPGAQQVSFSVCARLKREGPPSARAEGFQSVIVCESHKDIARAFSVWAEYPSSDQPPEQSFRTKGGGKGKLQQFFTPLRPASGRAAGHRGAPAQAAQQASAHVTGAAVSPADGRAGPTTDPGTAAAPATGVEMEAERQAGGHLLHEAGSPWVSTAVAKRKSGGSDDTAAGSAASKQQRAMGATTSRETDAVGRQAGGGDPPKPAAKKDAFATLMASARGKPSTQAVSIQVQAQTLARGPAVDALRKVALNPERERSKHPAMVVADSFVIIEDAYPKARCHSLVIARDPSLDGPANLTAKHIPLLQQMKEGAQMWVEEKRKKYPDLAPARVGFHSLPSLRQLHLHIISQDFDSASLKTKKHWNSFTTAYFLLLKEAMEQLQENGRLSIDDSRMKELLKADLRCHRCGAASKTIPALKAHIAQCQTELKAEPYDF